MAISGPYLLNDIFGLLEALPSRYQENTQQSSEPGHGQRYERTVRYVWLARTLLDTIEQVL